MYQCIDQLEAECVYPLHPIHFLYDHSIELEQQVLVLSSGILYSTVQISAVVQYRALQGSAVQCSAVQYSTVQYSSV